MLTERIKQGSKEVACELHFKRRLRVTWQTRGKQVFTSTWGDGRGGMHDATG
jgi:hypothetical protein